MGKTARNRRKIQAFRRGWMSEYLAAVYLMCKGYRILALRHRTKLGEIDIIAKKGDLIVFCEVKARRSAEEAIFAVSPSAQRRIRDASDLWLSQQKNSALFSFRYDVIAIVPWSRPRHFEDCF